jgi:hypothetical protein
LFREFPRRHVKPINTLPGEGENRCRFDYVSAWLRSAAKALTGRFTASININMLADTSMRTKSKPDFENENLTPRRKESVCASEQMARRSFLTHADA